MTLAGIASVRAAGGQVSSSDETVVIDSNAPAHPFPHIWEEMFGSGRAVLSLRQSYRADLASVKKITGFKYVRFHAIFHDDMGVYDEDAQGRPVYNFSYVDQVYDGLLENGVKPFVERGIPKAAFRVFELLHRLGDRRLSIKSENALATKRNDGTSYWLFGIMPSRARISEPKLFGLTSKDQAQHGIECNSLTRIMDRR